MRITASVFINDDESGVHHGYEVWLEELAPETGVGQDDRRVIPMSFLNRFRRKASLFSGGSGESMADAVIINAADHSRGVRAEYEYLSRRYGRRHVDWSLVSQELTEETESGRWYDTLTVRLKSGEVREFYFDITQFFGRY